MKKLIAIIAVALPLALPPSAVDRVYPTMNVQQILDEAQSIAKYVQMINTSSRSMCRQPGQRASMRRHHADLKNLEPGSTSKIWWPTPTATSR